MLLIPICTSLSTDNFHFSEYRHFSFDKNYKPINESHTHHTCLSFFTFNTHNMHGILLYGRNDLKLAPLPPLAPLGPTDVLLSVAYCGLCWSDVLEYTACPVFSHDRLRDGRLDPPLCLGHEYAGTVARVGSAVTAVRAGDRVCVNIAVPCARPLECRACAGGQPHACARLAIRGLSAAGGGLCPRVVLPETALHVLPAAVSLQLGALVEPLAIAWHAVCQSGMKPGETALVVGTGPIGLACVLALQGRGARAIVATEPGAVRRQRARELGADWVFDPGAYETTRMLVERVVEAAGGDVDVSFDCGGTQETLDTALNSLRHGGTAVNLAVWARQQAVIFPMDLTVRERRYMGSIGFSAEDMGEVVEALASGRIPQERARRLISTVIPLERAIEDGFHELMYNRDAHVKILVEM